MKRSVLHIYHVRDGRAGRECYCDFNREHRAKHRRAKGRQSPSVCLRLRRCDTPREYQLRVRVGWHVMTAGE